jgi:hypothetical protein
MRILLLILISLALAGCDLPPDFGDKLATGLAGASDIYQQTHPPVYRVYPTTGAVVCVKNC